MRRKKLPPSPDAAKSQTQATPTLGVYIHFPWCLKKCPYCDFLSIAAPRQEIPQHDYTQAVQREIAARAQQLPTRVIHSVFLGGGTPSLWEAKRIGEVLDTLDRFLHLPPDTEITVECNPSSFSLEYGRELRVAGVNRVSIGVQGLNEERLRFLGRLHDAGSATSAIEAALEADFLNVSGDLIYGVHSQSPAEAAAETQRIAELGVHHLSAYALTIEPGTAFGAQRRKGTLPLLSEDMVADSFDAVSATLRSLGFDHYEVSNFSRPSRASRHNLGYWRGEPYLGIGCGAWGTLYQSNDTALRYRNTVVPERYMSLRDWKAPHEATPGPGQAYQQLERLDAETLLAERLMLGLRLEEGVNVERLQSLGVELFTQERQTAVQRLTAQGKLVVTEQRWSIPKSAWLLSDAIIRELL